jgi:hypothetical protein
MCGCAFSPRGIYKVCKLVGRSSLIEGSFRGQLCEFRAVNAAFDRGHCGDSLISPTAPVAYACIRRRVHRNRPLPLIRDQIRMHTLREGTEIRSNYQQARNIPMGSVSFLAKTRNSEEWNLKFTPEREYSLHSDRKSDLPDALVAFPKLTSAPFSVF